MRAPARAWLFAAFVFSVTPGIGEAQVFVAARPHPEFQIGPLFVRASVTPELGPLTVDVFWSLIIPAHRSAVELEQDLYLLWPNAVIGDPSVGKPDPTLTRYVETRGFAVIDEGRLPLFARNLYETGTEHSSEPVPGGAPFVTFVRQGGALGLSSPATYIHIPWTPKLANRVWLMDLRMRTKGQIKPKPTTWMEHTFWGTRHRLLLSFNAVNQSAVFPLYFETRDRVVRLGEEPAQLLVNFAKADHLKIDEISPPSSRRQLSETLDNTEVVSLFLDRTESIRPQVLTVQFGYFTGWQSWAPVLIAVAFFVLGNFVGPVMMMIARRTGRAISARIHVGPPSGDPSRRARGVVLSSQTLNRIVPGTTTYEEVLRICGAGAEVHEQLGAPEQRTLIYRGRRVVPQRRRTFGWIATVSHWDIEHHEVEIALERDVVRDVQARVQRTRLSHPEPD